MKDFSLEQYAKELYSRRNEAIDLCWADCGDEEWSPKEKECHLNVTELCAGNTDLKPIRGWLCYDSHLTNLVIFIAHSVVNSSDGKFYDITPPNTIKRPPFIIARESEEEFEKMVINFGDFKYDRGSANA